MTKEIKGDLGFLGVDYQYMLVKVFIEDKPFFKKAWLIYIKIEINSIEKGKKSEKFKRRILFDKSLFLQ